MMQRKLVWVGFGCSFLASMPPSLSVVVEGGFQNIAVAGQLREGITSALLAFLVVVSRGEDKGGEAREVS
jgi:hypothetical protein